MVTVFFVKQPHTLYTCFSHFYDINILVFLTFNILVIQRDALVPPCGASLGRGLLHY